MATTESEQLTPAITYVEHTADWAMQVRARDLAELFSQAALGLAQLLTDELESLPRTVTREIELTSVDVESLLVAWLGELAFWAETEGLVFPTIDIRAIHAEELRAVVTGGPADELLNHIKAVTYHDLEIVPVPGGLETTVVFDV